MSTMKISVLTGCISQDLLATARFVKEHGLDGLDIDVVWGQPVERIVGTEDAKTLIHVLKQERITTFCLATRIFEGWLDSSESFHRDLHSFEKCLDFADSLNTSLVRCFSFRRSESVEANFPRLLERLEAAAEISAKKGITLGIQNDATTFLGTGKSVEKVIRSIGNPYLKSIWDPCASLYDLDAPEIPYPDGYRCVQPYLIHVMLRDVDRHKYRGTLCEVEFGEGLIDFRKQIKSLWDDGFDGAVSLATQWHPGMDWDTSLNEVDFTEQGGQEALLICLANLKKIIGV
jgi:sugar phosphate isomerase/epimerase